MRPMLAIIVVLFSIPFSLPRLNLASAHAFEAHSPHVRIGVFGLFHPAHLTITAISGHALLIRAGGNETVLETSSGASAAKLQLFGATINAAVGDQMFHSYDVLVTARDGQPMDFDLAVPGRISRRYQGTLELRVSRGEILAIVTMDLETAVASVVAAESTSDMPIEAIKAQAVATRSYLVSGRGRHSQFDFCDTTHCQFLREPPKIGTPLADAVSATRGLVLAYHSQPFAAMYTRSCSGHTLTPAQVGLSSSDYPFYEVECKYCQAHPSQWTSRISSQDAASLHHLDEASRLALVRRLGWSTVPSSDFTSLTSRGQVVLHGTGYGHGIGLCQAGAKSMAESGATFQQILAHYYPNASVIEWTH
jgi:stage II sporulation protein D